MTLGQRISEYRKKLGISQEELGARLGVSRQAVSKWETDIASPDMENLLALSREFGISVAELTATPEDYALGDWVFVPGIREAILSGRQAFDAYVVKADGSVKKTSVSTGALTEDERQIIADGCLINYFRNH